MKQRGAMEIYDSANDRQLHTLIDSGSHDAVLTEVLAVPDLIPPGKHATAAISAFMFTVDLYEGRYRGYRACNTDYHDLHHTIDTFLTMARLIHGATINEVTFTKRQIVVGLISALAHDCGYIQRRSDSTGTGAKYTASHVQRSMDFLMCYSAEYKLSEPEASMCRTMILCTDLSVDISQMEFPSLQIELLGKMLGAADLLSQMADRAYLERLRFLYSEFKEADVGGYESVVDLLKRTVPFYGMVADRLEAMNVDINRFLVSHFVSRWGIEENLYVKAIERQREYLQKILKIPDSEPLRYLQRIRNIGDVRSEHPKQ
jgi:hypothetical protein